MFKQPKEENLCSRKLIYAQVFLNKVKGAELLSFHESNLKFHILERQHEILHVPPNTDDIILASKSSIG